MSGRSRLEHISNLASEYDMRPSRIAADSEHMYGALYIGNVGGEWELHGFNTLEEFNEALVGYFGDKLCEDTVDRIVNLDTGKNVEFTRGIIFKTQPEE